jgi:sugar/nucleoside kinase (ribokinase family)
VVDSSGVVVKRLSGGKPAWEVSVAADDNTPDALRVAKERALAVDAELRTELAPHSEAILAALRDADLTKAELGERLHFGATVIEECLQELRSGGLVVVVGQGPRGANVFRAT